MRESEGERGRERERKGERERTHGCWRQRYAYVVCLMPISIPALVSAVINLAIIASVSAVVAGTVVVVVVVVVVVDTVGAFSPKKNTAIHQQMPAQNPTFEVIR